MNCGMVDSSVEADRVGSKYMYRVYMYVGKRSANELTTVLKRIDRVKMHIYLKLPFSSPFLIRYKDTESYVNGWGIHAEYNCKIVFRGRSNCFQFPDNCSKFLNHQHVTGIYHQISISTFLSVE